MVNKCNWNIKNRNIFLNDYYLFYKNGSNILKIIQIKYY